MTRPQQIMTAFAWSLDQATGPIYPTVEAAITDAPYARDAGLELLKLYVDEQGRIVHTEEAKP